MSQAYQRRFLADTGVIIAEEKQRLCTYSDACRSVEGFDDKSYFSNGH